MVDREGTARRDAALTVVVLAVVVSAAVVLGAPVSPLALVAGAGATVVAELLLSLRAARVRRVWVDPRVQVTAVVTATVGGVALALAAGLWLLTALVAALLTYLVVLGGSVAWRWTR